MIKRTFTVLIAALVLGVAGGAVASTASATIIATPGHYSGHDSQENHIGLHWNTQQHMNNFTVNYHFVIGGAHTSNAMWHETCHNGYCTAGAWTGPRTISGYYRHGSSGHKVHWTVHWIRH